MNKHFESWSMSKESIDAARAAIENGIEYAKELLAKRDIEYGRTTRSNQFLAEYMEDCIAQMESALDGLKEPNGCSYGKVTVPQKCTECGTAMVYVRTRNFVDGDSHVWCCGKKGCKNHGMYSHTDSRHNK